MPFISSKPRKRAEHGKQLPPPSAWGHYRVRREKSAALKYADNRKKEKKTLISLENVTLGYEGRTVVENISFTVREGDYISIIGENGTGKSTLLNALLSLGRVTSGKISFLSVERSEIGVLPQQNNTRRDFPATVFEVVLTGCLDRSSHGPFITRNARNEAFSNMERLGITPLANRSFGTLSGGQRQRVMLARALCAAKKMLVLDEPVTGLDPKTTAEIYSLVEHLNRDNGVAVVSVTHDIPSALKYSSHILRLNKNGYFFGTREEFLALPEAQRYTETQHDSQETPYGEGGFRYSGGAI
jgi:zinc transport system ATP-binding protein